MIVRTREDRFQRSPTGPRVAPPRRAEQPAFALAPLRVAGGNRRRHHAVGRSSSSCCWFPASAFAPIATCRGPMPGITGKTSILAEPDLVADRRCRSRWRRPGQALRCSQRQDRPRRRELVPRAARRGPSHGRRRRPDVLPGRRFESGHHHGRDHPLARAGDRRRHRRCLGPRPALLLRQRLRASSLPAARPAIGVEGSRLGVHRFVTTAAGATIPSPTPSGSRAWC